MVNSGTKRPRHFRSEKENVPRDRNRANIRIHPKKPYKMTLEDLGCVLISDDSSSDTENLEITPCVSGGADESLCLKAPRVLLDSQRDNTQPLTQTVIRAPKREICSHGYEEVLAMRPEISNGYTDNFSRLSDEMILRIYHWLPKFTLAKCARVCHRWNRVVGDKSLWKRIDLANRRITSSCLGLVLYRGANVLRLTKTEMIEDGFDGYWKRDKTGFQCLQYLDLSLSSASIELMGHLFTSCQNLRKLSLELCTIDDDVAHLFGQNENLQVLNLSMCSGLTMSGLAAILNGCRRLTSLNLSWTGLRRQSLAYLSLALPPSVRKLNLSGCRENITDEEVLQLVKTCPGLMELDLSDSTVITGLSITYIMSHLDNLQYLALSRCYRLSVHNIRELAQHTSLTEVEVFGMFRDGTMEQLKQEMVNVELNRYPFSSVARPTTGIRMTSLWGLRVRDNAV
ncbi:S-phase kinase-associated protein 2-like [Ostrea edulis]|uniref:S-phase kinase-associated protein 2-like n=1 Tax=Ostrea edulis TaxID=37623 RepID=UPI00209433C5|nr:S-phase kinase-associated protein 2-like [Ostrea edulis]